jgi:hypothetical protein
MVLILLAVLLNVGTEIEKMLEQNALFMESQYDEPAHTTIAIQK